MELDQKVVRTLQRTVLASDGRLTEVTLPEDLKGKVEAVTEVT